MIPRYSRPEMAAIWEPANKFRIWFEIEAHACDAQACRMPGKRWNLAALSVSTVLMGIVTYVDFFLVSL